MKSRSASQASRVYTTTPPRQYADAPGTARSAAVIRPPAADSATATVSFRALSIAGLPFGRQSYEHSQCSDIGVVAKRYPDMSFLIYHSGFVTGVEERVYDHAARRDGIDTLIRSLIDNDVKPGSNVYAELGSTWRFLMRDPTQAAHALGKLIRYCGESNVLWGTDSIWYGSPQDQIQAFRTFQIAPALREKHGYAEITPELRAKIFGLNAARVYNVSPAEVKKYLARDAVAEERVAYSERPEPHFRTYGPKTRREFLNLLAWNGGSRA